MRPDHYDEFVRGSHPPFAVLHSERPARQLLGELHDVANFPANFLAQKISAGRKITNRTLKNRLLLWRGRRR